MDDKLDNFQCAFLVEVVENKSGKEQEIYSLFSLRFFKRNRLASD